MGVWQEVQTAKNENRHEIKLSGAAISKRIETEGLDSAVFTLTSINLLNISETCLPAVPDQINQLGNLTSLLLFGNKIAEFNENITSLSKLKVLDLSRNQIVIIPESINKLKELNNINFSSNQIESFPKLEDLPNLISINCSNNKLNLFPDTEGTVLPHLTDVKLNGNVIENIPPYLTKSMPVLKNFDIGDNKIKVIPGELAGLLKLKELNLKGNKLADKRLMKLVDQCRTKQVVDYIRDHCPKSDVSQPTGKKGKKGQNKKEEQPQDEEVCELCHSLTILHVEDMVPKVKIIEQLVANVRPYVLCCIIKGVNFTEETFKKFIQLQTKLHETVCQKRNFATIATHDLKKIAEGDLTYTAKTPSSLVLTPLMRQKPYTGEHLFHQLREEAEALRKEKKRNVYSGIHKFLYLLEGKSKYPCLEDSSGKVISFPPITNSEETKMSVETKDMLIEVTSSISTAACKTVLDKVLQDFLLLGIGDSGDNAFHSLTVQQVKVVDLEGNMKSVYPSRTDCSYEGSSAVKVLRHK